MNEDRAIELLPWYENGSLEQDERREIAEALARSESLRAEQRQVREVLSLFSYRLPSEVLVDHLFDRETPGLSRDTVARFLELVPAAREEAELVAESRRALEGAEAAERGDNVTPFRSPAKASVFDGWRRLALAASVVGAVALAGFVWSWQQLGVRSGELAELRERLEATGLEAGSEQIAAGKSDLIDRIQQQEEEIERLGEQVAELDAPESNFPVIPALPRDFQVRGEETAVVALDAAVRRAALLLGTQLASDLEAVDWRVTDADGDIVYRSQKPLARDPVHGDFSIVLPVRAMGAGEFVLELLADGEVVESYRLRVE